MFVEVSFFKGGVRIMTKEKEVQRILSAYRMYPKEIVDHGDGVFFVRDQEASFVLHRSTMDKKQTSQWASVFDEANKHSMASVLPVYPTAQGELYVEENEFVYYLTPYIRAEGSVNIVDLFQAVADIHLKTKRTFLIDKSEIVTSFRLYEEELKAKHLHVRQTIDLFEQQRYMSPFELQVCSHFHVVDDAFHKSAEHITSLLDICADDEHKHVEWSSSLCHNRLSTEHVLKDQEQYITHWEAASMANSMTDIAHLCRNEFHRNEYPLPPFVEGLQAYDEIYELSDVEEHILAIHLLHPLPYVEMLRSYLSARDEKAVISFVMDIERTFRSIANSFFLLQAFEEQKPNMFSEDQ